MPSRIFCRSSTGASQAGDDPRPDDSSDVVATGPYSMSPVALPLIGKLVDEHRRATGSVRHATRPRQSKIVASGLRFDLSRLPLEIVDMIGSHLVVEMSVADRAHRNAFGAEAADHLLARHAAAFKRHVVGEGMREDRKLAAVRLLGSGPTDADPRHGIAAMRDATLRQTALIDIAEAFAAGPSRESGIARQVLEEGRPVAALELSALLLADLAKSVFRSSSDHPDTVRAILDESVAIARDAMIPTLLDTPYLIGRLPVTEQAERFESQLLAWEAIVSNTVDAGSVPPPNADAVPHRPNQHRVFQSFRQLGFRIRLSIPPDQQADRFARLQTIYNAVLAQVVAGRHPTLRLDD